MRVIPSYEANFSLLYQGGHWRLVHGHFCVSLNYFFVENVSYSDHIVNFSLLYQGGHWRLVHLMFQTQFERPWLHHTPWLWLGRQNLPKW